MRTVFVGGPRTGKSTAAKKLAAARGIDCRSTDSLIHLGWSGASEKAAEWLGQDGPSVIEGVATARALRKWLRAHPAPALPADHVIWADKPFVSRSPGQESMAKGVEKVWREVLPELQRRGVRVTTGVHTMDLGVGDVHVAGGGDEPPARPENPAEVVRRVTAERMRAEGRNMKGSAGKQKRLRSALARLEKAEGKTADGSAKKDRRARVPRSLHIRADLAPGGALHVRHMGDEETTVYLPVVVLNADGI